MKMQVGYPIIQNVIQKIIFPKVLLANLYKLNRLLLNFLVNIVKS